MLGSVGAQWNWKDKVNHSVEGMTDVRKTKKYEGESWILARAIQQFGRIFSVELWNFGILFKGILHWPQRRSHLVGLVERGGQARSYKEQFCIWVVYYMQLYKSGFVMMNNIFRNVVVTSNESKRAIFEKRDDCTNLCSDAIHNMFASDNTIHVPLVNVSFYLIEF